MVYGEILGHMKVKIMHKFFVMESNISRKFWIKVTFVVNVVPVNLRP